MTANEPKVRGRLILPDERAARAALNLLKELIVVESHHIQKHGGLVSLSIKGLIRLDVVAEAEDNEFTINELRDLGWNVEDLF